MSQFFSLWAMGNGQLGTATAHNALGKFLFITLRKVKMQSISHLKSL